MWQQQGYALIGARNLGVPATANRRVQVMKNGIAVDLQRIGNGRPDCARQNEAHA